MTLSKDAKQAIALLRNSQPRIYLGARYGLTPHTRLSPLQAHHFLGLDAGREQADPFCEVASELARNLGLAAPREAFSDKAVDLDTIPPDADEELSLLRPIAAGKIFVTGSYSSRIVNNFQPLTAAFDEQGRKNIRLDGLSRNPLLVMLHGWQGNPTTALVTREEIESYDTERPTLAELIRGLLIEKPWIILGYRTSEDVTFSRLCWEVCKGLGVGQRPLYVVDPQKPEIVDQQWVHDPLRHIQMDVLAFLKHVAEVPGTAPSPRPPKGQPPAPPKPPSDEPDFVDEAPDPPADTAPSQPAHANGGKDSTSAPPPDAPGPNSPRQLRIRSLDGRAFRTTADGDMRVSVLASRFIQQDTGSENASGRRAVVDRLGASGQRSRCNGHDTLAEAGIEDGDELCIYTDTVAGAMDPKRHEAYLNDVQQQLENLARQDARISVKPNLPQASDRYEVVLRCGGWGPPEDSAMRPIRTFEQKVRIDYPAEAPNAPPIVRWTSEIYHPNVKPKTGYVCLGALQETFTPLFGPQELVRMLIELSEYRNFELDGVLNREAAIWAQLNPDIIVAHGGWAYQPTLEEKRDDETETQLSFEPQPTGVGLRRRRKS